MIKDIMSESFVAFSSEDKVGKLLRFIADNEDTKYIVIHFPDGNFSVIENLTAKEISKKIGEKVGRVVIELALASISEFGQFCDSVSVNENEQIARSKAMRSPSRQTVVLEGDRIVGVIKQQVRGAMFAGIPATLYGERYDIFEKGAVKPKYQITCAECESKFDFYELRIEDGKILYYCPVCRKPVRE